MFRASSLSQKINWPSLSLLRIPSDIAHAICQVFLVTNETIKIIALPQATGTPEQRIDSSRRETLPTANQLSQRPFRILQKSVGGTRARFRGSTARGERANHTSRSA